MSAAMGFLAAEVAVDVDVTAAHQQAWEYATQRRCEAGQALKAARRNGLTSPNSCRNSELVAVAIADVVAAQAKLDQLESAAVHVLTDRAAPSS